MSVARAVTPFPFRFHFVPRVFKPLEIPTILSEDSSYLGDTIMLRSLLTLLLDLLADPTSWLDQPPESWSPSITFLGKMSIDDGVPDPAGEFVLTGDPDEDDSFFDGTTF